MVTIEISIDEDILREAEAVLDFVGMDVQTAINIFLRRVVSERRFPMSMSAPPSGSRKGKFSDNKQGALVGDSVQRTETKGTITRKMVEEVWRAFVRYQKGLGEISNLSNEVADNSGINRGSAYIYLNILSKLVEGELNTRVLKIEDLKYLMKKIKTELGEKEYRNAMQSLRKSIPYWRKKIPGLFADKVEAYFNLHQANGEKEGWDDDTGK